MDELKKLLLAYLAKTLGMDGTAVAALYDADGNPKADTLTTLLSKDAERVATFKQNETTRFDDGYKKAQKEALSKLESDFKEKYKIQSDKKGLELIEEFIAANSNNKVVTDEDVKKHPLYLAKESEVVSAAEKKEQEWKTKFEQRENEIKSKEVLSYVISEARTILDKLNPNLPEDAVHKKNQLEWFENKISAMKFEIKENQDGTKKIIALDKDGKARLEDQHGSAIPFEDVIKSTASQYWTFQAADSRSAGDPNKKGAAGAGAGGGNGTEKKWKFTKPRDDAEFQKLYAEIEANTEWSPNEKREAKSDLVKIREDGAAK